ncbi:MAG: hypothetical protein JO113_09690 [Candidatus Eremiobacteraeota bacterium]|nr:hypothetical protein [Candidatus Eremiobacteraeota bacterium]
MITAGRVRGYARTGGRRLIELTGLIDPGGIAFDFNHHLYVSDEQQTAVFVYKPGSVSPFKTIHMPASYTPFNVAVDSGGRLWVGTYYRYGPGNLTEFDANGNVLQTVQCPSMTDYTRPIAIDRKGDVFIDSPIGIHQYIPYVNEVPAGQHSCKRLPVKLSSFGGLAVTDAGGLVVGDYYNFDAFTYAPPGFRRVVARTNLGGGNPHGASFPEAIALTHGNSGIWVATESGSGDYAAALYRYPRGSSKRLVHIRLSNGASAVAVDY